MLHTEHSLVVKSNLITFNSITFPLERASVCKSGIDYTKETTTQWIRFCVLEPFTLLNLHKKSLHSTLYSEEQQMPPTNSRTIVNKHNKQREPERTTSIYLGLQFSASNAEQVALFAKYSHDWICTQHLERRLEWHFTACQDGWLYWMCYALYVMNEIHEFAPSFSYPKNFHFVQHTAEVYFWVFPVLLPARAWICNFATHSEPAKSILKLLSHSWAFLYSKFSFQYTFHLNAPSTKVL